MLESYYLSQFLPIANELISRGNNVFFVHYGQDIHAAYALDMPGAVNVSVRDAGEALQYYADTGPDWIFFANKFDGIELLPRKIKTAQIGHGVGPKMSYYTQSGSATTVRFVEGSRKFQVLREMFPEQDLVLAGYAKMDDVFRGNVQAVDLQSIGLDPAKKTILYAPTFYPSSIELFTDEFPQEFSEYNIIVKPHQFSIDKKRYAKQRSKFKKWSRYTNVYFPQMGPDTLINSMIVSDILISEASSTMYEFAALDKPIVICDFTKLRWSYRGVFSFRHSNRMDPDLVRFGDIGAHAANYSELRRVVDAEMANPERYRSKRLQYTEELVGATDGLASKRIVDYIVSNA